MPDDQIHLEQQVRQLAESSDKAALGLLLSRRRTSDIAEVVELLDNDSRRIVFDVLDRPSCAEVLEKVDEATRVELFELLTDSELADLVVELDIDDAADLLAELPFERQEWLLKRMSPDVSERIKDLMHYSEDSAGGIMDPVLISVREEATVAEAIDRIRSAHIDEDFYSVYVVNRAGQFIGDVRLRLLLTCHEDTKISELVSHDTIHVGADADQEEVRNIFSKNDLIVLPVLDKKHKLVGRITADRVIEVAEQEAAEDLYTMAGTEPDELESMSILRAARIRMTWLLPCLFGTAITALVLTGFSKKFSLMELPLIYTAAVAFVPMIAAISGNAGLQTSAIVVSGLATGHLAALKLGQVFTREVRIAMVVALCCGLAGIAACSLLIEYETVVAVSQPLRIALAFGVAMFIAIMVATTLGLLLPFLFRRIGIDPAISSGPLVTTANDSISVAIYMTLTLLLLG